MRSRLARYLLTLILPSGLLMLLFLSSLYHEEQALLRQHLEAAEEIRLIAGARSLTGDVALIASDVRLMASLPSLVALLEADGPPEIVAFTADLVALSASRRVYDQLRWIDEHGRERVRVDFIDGRSFVVPEAQLQIKSQRYYFAATMQLAPGEIFISPLDLNVEQDRVETPPKPTIRLAIPVRDGAGRPRGIVIANYFVSRLLDKFSEVTEARETSARINLLNRDGYWLKAPEAVDDWGFMYGRKEHFGTRFPGPWKRMSGTERGQFADADGLWSFTTVRPMVAGMAYATGAPQLASGAVPQLRGDDYIWKVVSHIPAETLRQGQYRKLLGWSLITALFMGVLLFGTFVLARAQRRRDVMAESLRALNRRLEEKVRQRTEELQKQAIRDPLTGLFNRRYLDETLPREIHRALREEEGLAVVMIISIISRPSTTSGDMRPAIWSCSVSPRRCSTGCGPRTSPAVTAARRFWSSCQAPMPRRRSHEFRQFPRRCATWMPAPRVATCRQLLSRPAWRRFRSTATTPKCCCALRIARSTWPRKRAATGWWSPVCQALRHKLAGRATSARRRRRRG